MDYSNILEKVDHTLLKVDATEEDIKETCLDGIKYNVASVCIPPCFVSYAKRIIKENGSSLKVCTVIGFPNGYNKCETKVFEAKSAIEDGADEVDMVINISLLKSKKYDLVLDEIKRVKDAVGSAPLKVIIETCLLTEEEKIKMCEIVSSSGAEYIKTSTGFSKYGATKEDVKLLKTLVTNGVEVKASGGISSIEDAKEYINLGASRLGTSKIVKILKEKGV